MSINAVNGKGRDSINMMAMMMFMMPFNAEGPVI